MSNIIRFSDCLVKVEEYNTELTYGLSDIRGVSNDKRLMPTKANMEGRDLSKFQIVAPDCFVFNRRTTRNGERIGMGYNQSDRPIICTEDYVVFKVNEEYKDLINPTYLYLFFCRDEFDRLARYYSWGSATEFFNWEDMQRVSMNLPPLSTQNQVVATWESLRKVKEQNEATAEPLMQLCRSYIQDIKRHYPSIAIGQYMTRLTQRNSSNAISDVRGVSTEKEFRIPNSRVDKDNLASYRIVNYHDFVFVPTTDTWKCLAICLSHEKTPFVVSPIYEAFKVDEQHIVPEYLHLFCKRKELDRYARFNSWGSARENFTYEDMERVKVPLPPIEVQQAIVNIYNCAIEAKRIADKAERDSKEICPALIQYAINN